GWASNVDNIAKENLTVNGENYKYLATAYVLVPGGDTQQLSDLTMEIKTGLNENITLNVPNAPVQRNYRTNVLGNLLTNQAEFTVVVDPIYNEPDYNVTQWDGTVADDVQPNAEGVYEIAYPSQLAWLAAQVDGGNTFNGKTVKLVSDLDLANIAWNPIADNGDDTGFQGTFDGNGKTIYNLYVDVTDAPEYQSAGLFANIRGAVLKNFTIENAVIKNSTVLTASDCGNAVVVGSSQFNSTIDNVDVKNGKVYSDHYIGGIAGYYAGTITNCDIEGLELVGTPNGTNGKYDNGDKVGGIVGYHNAGNNETTNNTVNNFTIHAYRDMGGIAGCGRGTFSGNKATNGTITVDQVTNFYETKAANAAAIVGRNEGATVDATNTFENVTIEEISAVVSTVEQLQAAIDAAVDGEETLILIQPGTYVSSKLNIAGSKKNIALVAVAPGVEIKGQVYINNTDKVTLKGLTLNNEGAQNTDGISVTRNNAVSIVNGQSEVVIEDCTFNLTSATDGSGIKDWWSTGDGIKVTVKNCTFNCNGQRAMQLHEYVDVQGCTFNEPYRYVMQMNSASETTVVWKNNHIVKKSDNGKPAYHIQLTCGGSEATKATANKTWTLEGNTADVTVPQGYFPYVYETNSVDASTMKGDWDKFVEIIDGINNVAKSQNGAYSVSSSEGFAYTIKNLLAADKTEIELAEGEYELGGLTGWKGEVTISGASKEGAVLKMSQAVYPSGAKLNFSNLTFSIPQLAFNQEQTYSAMYHTSGLDIDNCVIKGCLTLSGNGETNITGTDFVNAVSSGFNGYGIFYYGNNGSTVNVKDCTFDMVSKAIVIYNHSSAVNSVKYTLNVEDCEFKASKTDDKAAIQMHTETGSIYGTVNIKNSTATGFLNVNGGLWNELMNNGSGTVTDKFDIYVDGTQVH
ncbi:MAG: hypothetical protein IJ328_03030, partial [Muribaculaceae bacterium]|nr:hypothetical protein [Muribaculaceae bacterium]